jgi:hypothetical protein
MLWLVLLLAACGPDDDTSGGDSDPQGSELTPDFQLVENPGCETVTDSDGVEHPVAGATNYWIGELAFSGDDVSGYEARVLLANDAWVEADPEVSDCRVYWQVTGTKADPGCTSCDFSLALHASLDRTESDCIDAFVDEEPAEQDFVYDVAVDDSGAITVYFDSGEVLAPTGGADDTGLWYQSDSQCKWF